MCVLFLFNSVVIFIFCVLIKYQFEQIMTPKILEVNAEVKDFAEDTLKAAVVLFSGYFVNQYRTGFAEPFEKTQNMFLSLVAGLFVFYYVVDPYLVRFVVKQGQEGYYTAKRRFA